MFVSILAAPITITISVVVVVVVVMVVWVPVPVAAFNEEPSTRGSDQAKHVATYFSDLAWIEFLAVGEQVTEPFAPLMLAPGAGSGTGGGEEDLDEMPGTRPACTVDDEQEVIADDCHGRIVGDAGDQYVAFIATEFQTDVPLIWVEIMCDGAAAYDHNPFHVRGRRCTKLKVFSTHPELERPLDSWLEWDLSNHRLASREHGKGRGAGT